MRIIGFFAAMSLGLCLGCSAAKPNLVNTCTLKQQHPYLLFGQADRAELAKRKDAHPLLTETWQKLLTLAQAPDSQRNWAAQLEARAFLWQVTRERRYADDALRLLADKLSQVDPAEFYKRVEFHLQSEPLRALALGWDWLHDAMTPQQRPELLPGLQAWAVAAFEHTEKQWWREASYNVGAIPVAGYALLAMAIKDDAVQPRIRTIHREGVRRIAQNFFPTSWRPSGICYEGPNYAIVGLKYPAVLAEALRRNGGEDLLGHSGARLAAQYLMYQWMPQGGCAPIGDNTAYGRRTFAAEYLLGIGRTHDAAALDCWLKNTDPRRLDELITYLWFPLDVKPSQASAGETPATRAPVSPPTGRYFEVGSNRAGYFLSRSKWNDPNAAFFAFVTRYDRCNHEHYDMNSFLLGGFGEAFATHKMLFPYNHEHHGVDFEHNMVIVDGGGWPAHDKPNSCGDDNSTDGLMVGQVAGPFADFVHGDAKGSYRDNTVPNSDPAIRADRYCLFVKDGPCPYLLVVDDIQFSHDEHQYDWLWHAPNLPVVAGQSGQNWLTIQGKSGDCRVHLLSPVSAAEAVKVEPVEQDAKLKRIRWPQKAVRAKFVAVAVLQPAGQQLPPTVTGDADSCTITFANGLEDRISWQSHEDRLLRGPRMLEAGDALLSMVRTHNGKVVGYVVGEGTKLCWQDQTLVEARDSVCVSAGPGGTEVSGRRRPYEGLPPLPPEIVTLKKPP